ncbi:glycosyltransferase [Alphaproteobacteria bacterium]|nr:glycosyltransferase [Alphaproteobacteria bacterium]
MQLFNKKPLVSVIIPFYNRVSLLKKSILSVLKQSLNDYEIILINDGSTLKIDEILSIVKFNKKIKLINLSKNYGVSTARNRGIKEATGKYIAFLDSDDEWVKDKLLKQMYQMEKYSQIITHTSYISFNMETLTKKIINAGATNYSYPLMTFRCRIATPTVIIKKDALEDISFNEKIHFGEDIIVWVNLAKKYGPIKGIDIPLTKVNINSKSAAKNKYLQKLAFEAIRTNCLEESKIMTFLHKLYSFIRS